MTAATILQRQQTHIDQLFAVLEVERFLRRPLLDQTADDLLLHLDLVDALESCVAQARGTALSGTRFRRTPARELRAELAALLAAGYDASDFAGRVRALRAMFAAQCEFENRDLLPRVAEHGSTRDVESLTSDVAEMHRHRREPPVERGARVMGGAA